MAIKVEISFKKDRLFIEGWPRSIGDGGHCITSIQEGNGWREDGLNLNTENSSRNSVSELDDAETYGEPGNFMCLVFPSARSNPKDGW